MEICSRKKDLNVNNKLSTILSANIDVQRNNRVRCCDIYLGRYSISSNWK